MTTATTKVPTRRRSRQSDLISIAAILEEMARDPRFAGSVGVRPEDATATREAA